MAAIFISHSEEDSRAAARFADALERHGYSTWYYERDTLPGISYLAQCDEAIGRCEAVLLLISVHSVASHEVAKEVEQAHRYNRRFLPILVEMSQAEFDRYGPEWRAALGTSAAAELRGDDVRHLAARVVQALRHWGVAPDRPPAPEGRDRPEALPPAEQRAVGKAWASDANQIDVHDLHKVVFRNGVIDEFLGGTGKYFLSANKGLGKTLLLTFKRSLLTDAYREGRDGRGQAPVFFVPEGKPYLDFMSDLRSLDRNHDSFLCALGNAKRLWAIALRVSVLSHHPGLFGRDDGPELARLPRRLAQWLQGGRVEPTVVFKELLGCSVRDINRAIDETENFLEHKFRLVHSGTFVFVDKVDQGIRNLPREAWVHVQAGLVEAAWDAMSANSHVKVHATIRQEAFSNYESDIKTNLYGATTVIRYSDADLAELLDRLSQCYEGGKTFKEFVRLGAVRHPRRALPEDSFAFLRRHTLGRPRDLVIIASELSRNQGALGEPLYRSLVAETSAAVLVPNVFEEMRAFLECLEDRGERLRFLGLLPYNVLTRADVVEVWLRFNGMGPEHAGAFEWDAPGLHHPFWELYGTGLLGVVAREPDGRAAVQRFKQPHDLTDYSRPALPEAEFYLIHPALDGFIRRHRPAGDYHLFQHIVVGHGCPWKEHYRTLHAIERRLFTLPGEDLRESVHAALKEVTAALSAGRPGRARAKAAGSETWGALGERLAAAGHDELRRLLDELIGREA